MFPQTPVTCMTQDEGKPRSTWEALKHQGQGIDSGIGSHHLNGSVAYGWLELVNTFDLFVPQFSSSIKWKYLATVLGSLYSKGLFIYLIYFGGALCGLWGARRGQFAISAVGFLFPPLGSLGLNSDWKCWQQVLSPADPSCQSKVSVDCNQ